MTHSHQRWCGDEEEPWVPAEAGSSAQPAADQGERRQRRCPRSWVSIVTICAAVMLQSLFFGGALAREAPDLQHPGDGSFELGGDVGAGSASRHLLQKTFSNAIQTSKLEYVGMTAGQPSNLTLALQLCFACGDGAGVIQAGEVVRVALPGFTQATGASATFETWGPDAKTFRTASWNAGSHLLTLTCTGKNINNQFINVFIPLTAGLSIPAVGIRIPVPEGGEKFTFYTTADERINAGLGIQILPRLVSGLLPVGSFTTTPAITFGHPLVGATSSLSLTLTGQMEIGKGEVVRLTLPGFTCQAGRACSGAIPFNVTSEPSALFKFAAWSVAGSRLMLTAADTIPARTSVRVVISEGGGLQIAAAGLFRNDASLLVSTNAVLGPVLGTPVSSSQPIGSFVTRGVELLSSPGYPLVAGRACVVELTLGLNRDLLRGERITLHLAGFSRDNVFTPVETGNLVFPLATWDEAKQELTFAAEELLQVGTIAVLRLLPQQARIRLPPFGVGKDSPLLRLSTTASLGPVLVPQPIENNGPTGAFSDSRATFYPPAAGEVVEIRLEFTVHMPMVEYDTITLRWRERT
ncbi:hypothetical protein T484DRAFT_1884239 [Baffinella frigidus]|nr:hypothetical protein T484DRAFT_1884239 [Cryptophyta sp. CCMP2293]